MIKETLNEVKDKLKEVMTDFQREISKFRTGRASVAILDGIKIDYFGTPMPINQLATLSVPDPNLIVVQPWDNNIINEVEKAIRTSHLNMNPINDGKTIKLPVPPLDEERRMDIIKTLKKYTEERKTSVRNIRREYRDLFKLMKDDKELSEDDEKRALDDLQTIIDEYVEKLEKTQKEKERHILED